MSVHRRKFDPDTLRRELDAQREAFRDIARGQMDALEAAFIVLQGDATKRADEELLFELHRHAHKLAGRGGTFGFPQVSETARALEIEMDRILRAGEPLNAGDIAGIGTMMADIGTAVDGMAAA